jgi:hypothetical protein
MRNALKQFFGLLLIVLIALPPVQAWGPTGHRVVGQIAMHHLTDQAKAEIEKILGHHDLALVSNWADEIRGIEEYRYLSPWHYVSINDDEKTYENSKINPRGDVIQAIKKCEATLRNKDASQKERQEALKLLVHFIGDVHNPLHVGRREDRGGNEIDVLFFDKKTNLHKVWDEEIIDFRRLSFTEYARFLDRFTPEQLEKLMADDLMVWVNESISYREKVYTFTEFDEHNGVKIPKLRWRYRDLAVPIIDQRLAEGGVRLASRLNAIFGG